MKLCLVAFYLVCAVALCSARPSTNDVPVGKAGNSVTETVRSLIEELRGSRESGEIKESPATPEEINDAISALVKAWPGMKKTFDDVNTDIEELGNKTDSNKNDLLEVLKGLWKDLRTNKRSARLAYLTFELILNKITTYGYSWEVHNNRLYHLIFVVSIELYETGAMRAEGEEFIKAFHADVQGIRDDIKWLAEEVASDLPQFKKDELPRPVEVEMEIAAIEYMSKKIDREIIDLKRSVKAMHWLLTKTDKDKPTAEKQELRSLIDELSALKQSLSNDIENGLEKAKERATRSVEIEDDVAEMGGSLMEEERGRKSKKGDRKKTSPATPELINGTIHALLKAWPLMESIYDDAKKNIEELHSADTTKHDKVEALEGLLEDWQAKDRVITLAYMLHKYTLNKITTSGYSWEVYNNRLFHLIFVVSAKLHKNGEKMPNAEEFVKALQADVQGIREEFNWITKEVASELPHLKKDELLRPAEVVKVIAAIEYTSKKIDKEIVGLTFSVKALYSYLSKAGEDKPTDKKQVLSELRSLMDEISALKRSHSNDLEDALDKANEREDFLNLENDE